MKKIIFSGILFLMVFNLLAQNEAWEAVWSGYPVENRGIRTFTFLDNTAYYVAWSVAYDALPAQNAVSAVGVTTDGGYTWTTYDPVSLPGLTNPGISMVFPTTPTTAYLAAYKRPDSTGEAGIWKTIDAGATWTRINTSGMFSNNMSFPMLIYFFDEYNGFVQGDPVNGEFEMYYTTDAGATWITIDNADIDDPLQGEYAEFDNLVAAGDSVWFLTNKSRIFRSVDRGHTWQAFQAPFDFDHPDNTGKLTFENDTNGWLLKRYGELYQTTDGGETWTLMVPNNLGNYSTDIACIPGVDKLVASESDTDKTDYGTKISYDGGHNWTKMDLYKFSYMTDYDYLSNIANVGGNNIPHTALGFRDAAFGLSGGFSAQDDPNDPNDLGDMGVFIFHNDYTNNISTNKVDEWQVYPNPANDVVYVTAKNNIQNISVYDLTGKEVIRLNKLENNNVRMDISGLEKGLYLIEIIDDTQAQKSLKLVVK